MRYSLKDQIKSLIEIFARNILGDVVYQFGGTGGTNNARYCYSVFLRHLVLAHQNKLWNNPMVCAELGPGDSLGTGLSALLSGVEKYYALDTLRFSNVEQNLIVFDELVHLFNKRDAIPDNQEFPNVHPILSDYSFPHYILTNEHLKLSLHPERIESIRKQISDCSNFQNKNLIYICPWDNLTLIQKESVDMIFSQAVLEYAEDIENIYSHMFYWLRPEGFISHEIDFKSSGTSSKWNSHWKYTDLQWRLIRGRVTLFINRWPHSYHIRLIKKIGFVIISDITQVTKSNSISLGDLSERFSKIVSEDDLTISGAFIQGKKSQ
jgi:hypothetical protein